VVFVGRLVVADTGWTGYTGALAISKKTITLNVVEALKGVPPSNTLTLQYVMFGKRAWVEERPSGGIRLDLRFFVKGSDYIVLASKVPSYNDENLYINGDASEGVWLNTPENLAGIRALVTRKSKLSRHDKLYCASDPPVRRWVCEAWPRGRHAPCIRVCLRLVG
jgi:hypothetical protein